MGHLEDALPGGGPFSGFGGSGRLGVAAE